MKSYTHLNYVSGIYKITNTANGNFYIGSSSRIGHRFRQHISALTHYKHRNPHLQNAWNKYGRDNFEFEVILLVENINDLLKIEQEKIDELRPHYNIDNAVRGNSPPPARRRRSTYKMTKKHRLVVSKTIKDLWKNNKEYMLACLRDPQRVETIRKSSIRMWRNPESRKKIVDKLNSVENKKKLSKKNKEWWKNNKEEFLERTSHPEVRKRKSDSAKRMWKREEYKEKRKASLIANYKTDSRRKITDINDIVEIRRLYDTRELSQSKIAEKYGISRSGVLSIGLRETWAWLEER